ncbi:hypothetical protein ACUKBL_00245 (plasmid) [Furfurilactobacillus rossiae]|uniref:hypothetical protein n=1 Tax=Furfurilactobacillus rossiae TaxID=231049 RepID=UPI001F43731D|nr:hypothetical protein [Furfurilactobacillus rossiae]MCF6164788.1 hypothetical protein [Furfurilactobacillus rossiae]
MSKTKVVLPTPMSHTDIVEKINKYEDVHGHGDGFEFKAVKKPTLLHGIHAVLVELFGSAI